VKKIRFGFRLAAEPLNSECIEGLGILVESQGLVKRWQLRRTAT